MCSCGQFCEGGYSIIVAEIKINGMTLYNCISEISIRKDGKLQARTKQQDPLSIQSAANILNSVPNDNIQFGYHSATGKQIRLTNDGLRAKRMNSHKMGADGVVYGAHPLNRRAVFEVKIVKSMGEWYEGLQFGIMRYKKGVPVESGPHIPSKCRGAVNHCVWSGQWLHYNLATRNELSEYGSVNLDDLREGDRVGLRLSEDGVLEFTVNGENQGIAAENIYTRNTDTYAVVDHFGSCVATEITKAGTILGLHVINMPIKIIILL